MSERVVDLNGCARCHGDGHPALVFKPFTHPVERCGGEPPFVEWAMCPTVNEPILLAVVPEP